MILTLTANPSLDRTVALAQPLLPGEVQSALSERVDAGGKGINVARVVAAAGLDALAVLPLSPGDPFEAALHATGLPTRPVLVPGRTRANLTIVDPSGVTTKLNLPGALVEPDDAQAVIDAVVDAAVGARWLVLAGSLPPGLAPEFYADVIRAVRAAHGARAPRCAVDTSGAALHAVVASAAPDLIKPNDEELAELAGVALEAGTDDLPARVLDVARRLVPDRVGSALVTLGAHGAVLVDATEAWFLPAPRVRVASTVGAGDSSLAGYLLAESAGEPAPERLRHAVRYGAAAAALPGTQPPHPADLPAHDAVAVRLT